MKSRLPSDIEAGPLGPVQRSCRNSRKCGSLPYPVYSPAMSREHEPNWPSMSPRSRCTLPNKTVIDTTPVGGNGIYWETSTAQGTFGWLRGVDLNHRPLGYENCNRIL